MTTPVHLVGSIGLDTVEEVFATCGSLLGPYLKRMPDGEPGGRRLWISWQFPVLRNPRTGGLPSGVIASEAKQSPAGRGLLRRSRSSQ